MNKFYCKNLKLIASHSPNIVFPFTKLPSHSRTWFYSIKLSISHSPNFTLIFWGEYSRMKSELKSMEVLLNNFKIANRVKFGKWEMSVNGIFLAIPYWAKLLYWSLQIIGYFFVLYIDLHASPHILPLKVSFWCIWKYYKAILKTVLWI